MDKILKWNELRTFQPVHGVSYLVKRSIDEVPSVKTFLDSYDWQTVGKSEKVAASDNDRWLDVSLLFHAEALSGEIIFEALKREDLLS